MLSLVIEAINENKDCIRSKDLADQFSALYRTSMGGMKTVAPTDLLMCFLFCCYVRHMRWAKIGPLLTMDNYVEKIEENNEKYLSLMNKNISNSNPIETGIIKQFENANTSSFF